MISIILCDDNIESLEETEKFILDMENDLPYPFQLDSYINANDLISRLDSDKKIYNNDILILDIDMPQLSGMEIAKYIKDNNMNVILIFLTSHTEYVYVSFEYAPFRYIRKEYMKIELKPAILNAFLCIDSKKNERIQLKTDHGICVINTSEIIFFDIQERKCNLYMTDGKIYTSRIRIRELRNKIDKEDNSFVQINSGCVIGMRHIVSLNNVEVKMVNGSILSISRRKKKEVHEIICEYLEKAL